MGLCSFNNGPIRRIDIRYMPISSFYTALIYFTGSKNFNKQMRLYAIKLGYKLNEYGLLAAYSALGLSNQLFAIRADVDLNQLES